MAEQGKWIEELKNKKLYEEKSANTLPVLI